MVHEYVAISLGKAGSVLIQHGPGEGLFVKVTLTASTAAKIVVWKQGDLYHTHRLEMPEHPQVCLAVDLFEVLAELAGLDLEQREQAAEATALSEQALAQLKRSGAAVGGSPSDGDTGDSATCESAP